MTIAKTPRRSAEQQPASLFTGQSTTGPGIAERHTDDFVINALAIVRRFVPNMTDEQQAQADQAIREFGGGDRPYIARRLGEGRSERNAAIRLDYQRGESMALLMRRYQLSRVTIWRVLELDGAA